MPESGRPQTSIVVVAHAEGRLLHACLTACDRAAAVAADAGRPCERLLVLSTPDADTRAWVLEMAPAGWRVLSSPSDGLAAARNFGIQCSAGLHVAIVDGGDLPCADWLVSAHAADEAAGMAVWHPELAVQFGPIREARLLFHPDAVAFGYDYAALVDANPYAGGVFARRSVFEMVPYPEPDIARGFALPDWHWNCAVVAAGIHHRVVLDTWHYVRLHAGGKSPSARALAERRRPGPAPLFEGRGRALVDRPPPG
jgi:hypothetical protein